MTMGRLLVQLGTGWQRHAKPKEGLTFLGVVQQGPQVGALAQRADGRYVQVNGDWVTALGTGKVRWALRSSAPRVTWGPTRPSPAPAATVVVTVRKRRVIPDQRQDG